MISCIFFSDLSTGPSCTMPTELSSEGYEENGNKYYRLYHGGDRADQFAASAKCESVGARLAMMKTQEDFDIVRSYRGKMIQLYSGN